MNYHPYAQQAIHRATYKYGPVAVGAASALIKSAINKVKYRKSGKRKFRSGYDRTGGYYGMGATGHEQKFIDHTLVSQTIASAGNIIELIPDIATGTGESNRIGRYIKVIKYGVRYDLYLASHTDKTLTQDTIRLIYFIDSQTNGAVPTVVDVLEAANYQSFNNLANRSRFRIMKDKTYSLNTPAGGGNGTTEDWAGFSKHGTCWLKLGMAMEYDSTTGAITERKTNNLYCLTISCCGRTNIQWRSRTRFTDGR